MKLGAPPLVERGLKNLMRCSSSTGKGGPQNFLNAQEAKIRRATCAQEPTVKNDVIRTSDFRMAITRVERQSDKKDGGVGMLEEDFGRSTINTVGKKIQSQPLLTVGRFPQGTSDLGRHFLNRWKHGRETRNLMSERGGDLCWDGMSPP